MKSIMMSIRPEWVAMILNGEKTVEIRKTIPNCELPITVYIYCTKDKSGNNNGDVIGRCYPMETSLKVIGGRGKVVARFTLNKVEKIMLPYTKFNSTEWVGCEAQRTLQTKTLDEKDLLKLSCLKEDEIYSYLNFKNSPNNVGYAWHIDNLEIFDKPKEISEFRKYSNIPHEYTDAIVKAFRKAFNDTNIPLTDQLKKAPQSYMFIEGEK